MTNTTTTSSGLVINATFDVSITGNPNAAAIEATINQAIAIYQSLFADNITVSILFRYSSTAPNGTSMGNLVARSNYVIYHEPWTTYINALNADEKTANDSAANASLPVSALSTNVIVSSANGRAVGLNTAPAMFGNGSVAVGGPFDGIVTLNSAQPLQFTRPTAAGNYDALRATEHEIDEVLGFGSSLDANSTDRRPQDLFSWSSPSVRNITTSGVRYLSIDAGNTNIVNFSQNSHGDFGDWLSDSCPNAAPHAQDAFECPGQVADLTLTSPEGINLDVIGYDLVGAGPTPTPTATPTVTPTATPTVTPTATPTVTPTPTPTPTATPTPTPIPPTVSLFAAPTSIGKTGTALFTVSASSVNPSQPIVVNYSMTGNAPLNADYTLSGTLGQITILPNQSSGSVGLTAITSKTRGREKAIMTITQGAGYSLPTVGKRHRIKPPKATVIINNR